MRIKQKFVEFHKYFLFFCFFLKLDGRPHLAHRCTKDQLTNVAGSSDRSVRKVTDCKSTAAVISKDGKFFTSHCNQKDPKITKPQIQLTPGSVFLV